MGRRSHYILCAILLFCHFCSTVLIDFFCRIRYCQVKVCMKENLEKIHRQCWKLDGIFIFYIYILVYFKVDIGYDWI